MDFLVTENPAKVGKVVSQIDFLRKFDQEIDSFRWSLKDILQVKSFILMTEFAFAHLVSLKY